MRGSRTSGTDRVQWVVTLFPEDHRRLRMMAAEKDRTLREIAHVAITDLWNKTKLEGESNEKKDTKR